jgi:hypothetical protein
MAYTYTLAAANFTDSVHGTAANATGVQAIVPQIVDRRYHKQVLSKSFFTKAGMIGPDAYNEGGVEGTAPGYPVIQKSDLNRQAGDVIKMSMRRKLTADHLTGGRVLNLQLVENEATYDFYNLKVSVERRRHAVYGYAGMSAQRNPFGESVKAIQSGLLQDWWAEQLDTEILYALWCGWTPNLIRAWGTTKCDPTGNANTLYGNDQSLDTTRTIANMVGDQTDNVNGKTFEVSLAYMEQNGIDPVAINGAGFYVALISPKAKLILLGDDRFRNAQLYAQSRGADHPLFKAADFVYNNHIIITYDKIRSILGAKNPDGTITVTSNTIASEADYSGIGGGVTAAQLHQTMILGANAVALADLGRTGVIDRKEDDYGNIVGSGIDAIYGARRADFAPESGTAVNQSSLRIINTII